LFETYKILVPYRRGAADSRSDAREASRSDTNDAMFNRRFVSRLAMKFQ
jgi:hypothetical protein